jgi:hypothetical protein
MHAAKKPAVSARNTKSAIDVLLERKSAQVFAPIHEASAQDSKGEHRYVQQDHEGHFQVFHLAGIPWVAFQSK